MSADILLDDTSQGCFGVAGLRLVVDPATNPEDLLDAASLLMNAGLGVLNGLDEAEDMGEALSRYWPAFYLLRQASFAMGEGHSRLLKRQGAAARMAKGGAA
jgi:hypothetical protein